MQAIKCELCGSNQLIKKDGFFQCEHCDTKYTLEEAKKLIVSGTVEVVTGNAEKERLLKNAETLLNLEEYKKAFTIFIDISNAFPDDFRGWWGSFYLPFIQYINTGKSYTPNVNDLVKAYRLFGNKTFYSNFFNKFFSWYGTQVRTMKYQNTKEYENYIYVPEGNQRFSPVS